MVVVVGRNQHIKTIFVQHLKIVTSKIILCIIMEEMEKVQNGENPNSIFYGL
jgi:hypothetical protein